MPRTKKRVQLRKRKVNKKVIRHNTHNKITPEQKAKENDMLKVLLGRQMMPSPQQTQQADKQQEKIERQYKTLMELKAELKNKQETKTNIAQETAETSAEIAKEEAEIKELKRQANESEKKYRHNRRVEQIKEQIRQKKEEFDEKNKEFDGRTQENKYKAEIINLNNQIKQEDDKIKDLERQISENKILEEKRMLEEELRIKQAQAKAKEEIINSDAFKNADTEYQKVYKDLLAVNAKNERLNMLIEHKEQQRRKGAENEAMKIFINQQNAGIPSPTKTKYVDSLVKEQTADMERTQYEEEIQHMKSEKRKIHKQKLETNTKLEEAKAFKNVVESAEFKQQQEEIAETRKQVVKKQEQAEALEKMNADIKRVKTLEAQNKAISNFDLSNTNAETVAAQLETFADQVSSVIENGNSEMKENQRHEAQLNEFMKVLDRNSERFANDVSLANFANNNLLQLITSKTKGKLPDDVADYSTGDLIKATEFGQMMLNLNTEFLTDEDRYNEFIESTEFKRFVWNPGNETNE